MSTVCKKECQKICQKEGHIKSNVAVLKGDHSKCEVIKRNFFEKFSH